MLRLQLVGILLVGPVVVLQVLQIEVARMLLELPVVEHHMVLVPVVVVVLVVLRIQKVVARTLQGLLVVERNFLGPGSSLAAVEQTLVVVVLVVPVVVVGLRTVLEVVPVVVLVVELQTVVEHQTVLVGVPVEVPVEVELRIDPVVAHVEMEPVRTALVVVPVEHNLHIQMVVPMVVVLRTVVALVGLQTAAELASTSETAPPALVAAGMAVVVEQTAAPDEPVASRHSTSGTTESWRSVAAQHGSPRSVVARSSNSTSQCSVALQKLVAHGSSFPMESPLRHEPVGG